MQGVSLCPVISLPTFLCSRGAGSGSTWPLEPTQSSALSVEGLQGRCIAGGVFSLVSSYALAGVHDGDRQGCIPWQACTSQAQGTPHTPGLALENGCPILRVPTSTLLSAPAEPHVGGGFLVPPSCSPSLQPGCTHTSHAGSGTVLPALQRLWPSSVLSAICSGTQWVVAFSSEVCIPSLGGAVGSWVSSSPLLCFSIRCLPVSGRSV